MDQHFRINAPLEQDNLVQGTVLAEEIRNFENEYYSHEMIQCHIKGCGTPHKKGYTAVTHDGRKVLIGGDCGKKFLGDETFSRHQNELQNKQRRSFLASVFRNPELNYNAIREAVLKLRDPVSKVDRFKTQLKTFLPDGVYQELYTSLISQGGVLSVDEETNNYASLNFSKRGGSSGTQRIRKQVARISGREALFNYDVLDKFGEVDAFLHKMSRDFEKLIELDVIKLSAQWQTCRDNIDKICVRISAYNQFVSQNNMQQICRWLCEKSYETVWNEQRLHMKVRDSDFWKDEVSYVVLESPVWFPLDCDFSAFSWRK